MGKVELPNTFFVSVFTAKGPQESQTLKARENVWRKDFALVKKDQVRDHLGKLDRGL